MVGHAGHSAFAHQLGKRIFDRQPGPLIDNAKNFRERFPQSFIRPPRDGVRDRVHKGDQALVIGHNYGIANAGQSNFRPHESIPSRDFFFKWK